jgi:5-methylcytosine-specific restriction enzyme subunit McrC
LLAPPVRAALEQALQAFAEVAPIPLEPAALAAAEPDRQTEAYRPLLDLCRLLADGFSSGARAGLLSGPAFLLDTERVFERFVTRAVVTRLAADLRYDVRAQELYAASRPTEDGTELQLRPDVVVERGGRPILVVDAKWKDLADAGPTPADLYQVLAYCTGLAVRRAVLVYPGRRDARREYALVRAPIRIDVCTMRVSGTVEACRRSFRRLGQVLARRRRARNEGG